MQTKQSGFKGGVLVSAIVACVAGLPAYAADVDNVDVEKLFKEGIYQRDRGNLFTSIEAFQTVITNQPTLNRARLELGVAYYRTLNFDAARKQVQTVLDDPKTPQNVRLTALAFLAQVKKDEEAMLSKRHVWVPSVSAGLLYDTNVNAGPNSNIIPGGLTVAPGSRARGDQGYLLQASLAHRYSYPTPMRFGESAASFVWQTQLSLLSRDYNSEHDFGLNTITLATGPGWLVPNNWRANIGFQADDITYGGSHLAVYTSVNPSASWQIKEGEVTLEATALNKNFKRPVDLGRNGHYYSTSVALGKLFNGGKLAIKGGLKAFTEHADKSIFTNDGFEYFLGANLVAWNNGTLFGRFNQKDSKFDGNIPIFDVPRDETELRLEIGFYHNFKEGAMKSWKLGGSLLKVDNSSNVSIYEYKREMTSINLSRSF